MTSNNGTTQNERTSAPLTVQRQFELYWISRLASSEKSDKALPAAEMKQLLQAFEQNCFGDPLTLELASDSEGVIGTVPTRSEWATPPTSSQSG